MIKTTPKIVTGIISALFGGAAVVGGIQSANINHSEAPISEQTQVVAPVEQKIEPKVETKTETQAVAIPFEVINIDDANLPQGQTRIDSEGTPGEIMITYEVTYIDGVETARRETGREVTRAPINRVVANGIYIAPAPAPQTTCVNGSYINTAGQTVCRPSYENNGNATAICKDGTYSYSQNRRGTCSHHGGVQNWLQKLVQLR